MSTKLVPKGLTTNGHNSTTDIQSGELNGSRAEDQSPGDGRIRRKLRKEPTDSPNSPKPSKSPAPDDVDLQTKFKVKRRPSLRNPKVPMGARPLPSLGSKPTSNQPPNTSQGLPSRSRQSSINDASQSQAGIKAESGFGSQQESESYSFLPPVNFDDLQSSLKLDDWGEFSSTSKPMKLPVRKASQASLTPSVNSTGNEKPMPSDIRKVSNESGSRSVRTSSMIQPPSKTGSLRGPSTQQDVMGPPPSKTGSISKPRRQSHFPIPSSSGSAGRAPRKSIGPGILTNSGPDYSIFSDNLAANADRQRQEHGTRQPRPRQSSGVQATSRHSVAAPGDVPSISSSRGAKAKSMQPPARLNSELLQLSGSGETWGTPTSAQKSGSRDAHAPGTPGSAKRASQMPGHATGLGARTISPTDARRMKRLSLVPNPPPMPQTPTASVPEPPPPRARSTVDSPSFIPRKSVTPSSNRTTPDHNRKSYNSVISISSSTSVNSIKSTNTQTRLQQTASVSRLPTLKSTGQTATSNGTEEGVPPVPAIPKAYESPKGEPESPYFAPRKASLQPVDSASLTSNSTLEYMSAPSQNSSDKDTPKPEKEQRSRRGTTNAQDLAEERASGAQNGRRTLQPLKLPPLNLLPLGNQSIEKMPAPDPKPITLSTPITPPLYRGPPKTPTTPMTASRATFMSRNREKDETVPFSAQHRASSSHHALRTETFPLPAKFSSHAPAPIDLPSPRKTTSPFGSSSLPKNSGEFPQLRSKPSIASVDRSSSNISAEQRTGRLTGPRALTSSKTVKSEAASQSEAEGSSFSSTIRRKLSLTRRRSSSKAEADAPKPPDHGSMPPPRLPASATMPGPLMADPNSAQKPSYLHSRRKSSNTDNIVRQERAKSEVYPKDAGLVTGDPKTSIDVKRHVPTKISTSSLRRPGSTASFSSTKLQICDAALDKHDMHAEEEMRVLARKRKKTDQEARELDELRKRAVPRDRVSPAQALKAAKLNIYERGEIVDYKDVFFCGTQDAKKFNGNLEAENVNFGYDDDRGDYNIVIGDHLSYRYEVVDVLGKGSFGQVVRCVDHKTGGLEAIKIIRNKKRFHQQALVEVNILQKIRDWDPDNRYSMVNFTQSFYFRGHLCISTELLGMNLYEFIKVHDFRGFSLKLIRRFTKQMLNCLVLLKSKRVIHCDLKPENILLAHPARSEIKVIDFGSSCLENEKVYTYIQSRFYRSPEVILGMTYGMPIDMWSLGCILAELLTGYPIFPGENEQEQLACIMEVFGPPDKHLIEKSTRKKLFFDSVGKPRLTVSSKGKRRRPSSKTLQQAIKCDDEAFLDFLARCLRWDPDRRMKPDEAIHHEFITGVKASTAGRITRHAPSSTNQGSSASPIKRFHSMHTPASTVRPLPEPPITALKSTTGGSAIRGVSGGSPNKTAPKRHSTVNTNSAATSHTIASARKGPGPAPTTSLPKVSSQRTASGKSDLASAAAAAATKSR